MEDFNNVYNDYIDSYVQLTTLEKRDELIKQVKELTIKVQQLALLQGKNAEFMINREMVDLNKEVVNEDDFLEGLFAYFCSLEEMIGICINDSSGIE